MPRALIQTLSVTNCRLGSPEWKRTMKLIAIPSGIRLSSASPLPT